MSDDRPARTERTTPRSGDGEGPFRSDLLVCLVNPWQHQGDPDGYYPPPSDCLGIGYVAAVLREEGFEVEIFDAYVTHREPEAVADDVAEAAGDRDLVLGFSFMCPTQLPHAERIVERLRERGVEPVHVTAGGQFGATSHGTLLTDESHVYDSVVWGEGEETVLELFRAFEAGDDWRHVDGVAARDDDGEVRLSIRGDDPDVESQPWPARDTLPQLAERDGVVNIDTSRGCESSCVFCMSREILKHTATKDRWRSRDPVDVVDEMEWIVGESGITRFNFTDENTIGNAEHRDRLLVLADEIRDRGLDVRFNAYVRAQDVDYELVDELHDAGLASIFIGIESFWQPTLDLLNKRIDVETNVEALRTVRRVDGPRLYFGLMTYHPWVDMEELLHNLDAVREHVLGIRLTGPELLKRLQQVMLLYKNTPSYMLAKRDGLVEKDSRYDQGICSYSLPEKPRRVLHFVKDALVDLMEPQHELYLTATAEENRGDEAVQRGTRALNLEADTHVLDATETFARAVAEGAGDAELEAIRDDAQRRTGELVEKIRTARFPEARGVANVDQPTDTFLAEAERVGS